jgi:3-deoxy-manno-octulosonate cytidylyltransferase (CMP-KDO synthetase)|tara:strand:+ start:81 stop:785 length:705 start_codon:yes stop_codon:yes gene_type:complete
MSASRLKGKPLLKINNLPIICHVLNKANETGLEAIVATEDKEIMTAIKQNCSGEAILTGNHKTGTDRIFEAFQKLKTKNVDYIINLQGDEPMIDPKDIINLNKLMIKNNSDIGTLASEIKEKSKLNSENIVKVITEKKLETNNFVKALNFSRKDLSKENSNIYHHIGIYCYKVSVLKKFINLNQTKNEINNRLEQLRALDNNIEINVALTNSTPIGVDTKEDYLALKKIMEYKS